MFRFVEPPDPNDCEETLELATLFLQNRLRAALEQAGIAFDSAEVTMQPTTVVPLETEADARKVLRLTDALEEHDDVQNVYANFDIPDAVLQAVEA